MNDEIFARFAAWADQILENHDFSGVVAYNFNLYEHTDETAVQLVGSTFYDSGNEDWACNAYFSSGEELFKLPHSLTAMTGKTPNALQFVWSGITFSGPRCPGLSGLVTRLLWAL